MGRVICRCWTADGIDFVIDSVDGRCPDREGWSERGVTCKREELDEWADIDWFQFSPYNRKR